MKNFVLGFLLGIIISIIIFFSVKGILDEKLIHFQGNEEGKLLYIYNDIIIYEELSLEDAQIIQDIFKNKKLYNDSPTCGFTLFISIQIGDLFFSPACDSCGIVKCNNNNKYFSITDEERNTIVQIFNKFGAKFPCN